MIKDAETGELLVDLTEHDQKVCLAEGESVVGAIFTLKLAPIVPHGKKHQAVLESVAYYIWN